MSHFDERDPNVVFEELAGQKFEQVFKHITRTSAEPTINDLATHGVEDGIQTQLYVKMGDVDNTNQSELLFPLGRRDFPDHFYILGITVDNVMLNDGMPLVCDLMKIDHKGNRVSLIAHHNTYNLTRPITESRSAGQCHKSAKGIAFLPSVVAIPQSFGGSLHTREAAKKIAAIANHVPSATIIDELLEVNGMSISTSGFCILNISTFKEPKFQSFWEFIKSNQFKTIVTTLDEKCPCSDKKGHMRDGPQDSRMLSPLLCTAITITLADLHHHTHVSIGKKDNLIFVMKPMEDDTNATFSSTYAFQGTLTVTVTK